MFPMKVFGMVNAINNNQVGPNGRIYMLRGSGSNGKSAIIDAIKRKWKINVIPESYTYVPELLSSLDKYVQSWNQTDINMYILRCEGIPTNAALDILDASGKNVIMETNHQVPMDIVNRVNYIDFPISFVENPIGPNQEKIVVGIDMLPLINQAIGA